MPEDLGTSPDTAGGPITTGDQGPSPADCAHDAITSFSETIEGRLFTWRQCRTCGMYNPPAVPTQAMIDAEV